MSISKYKPQLANTVTSLNPEYTYVVQPKLDGIRALVIGGVVYSRSLKPIPNKHIQTTFGKDAYNGLDGELVWGSPTSPTVYNDTQSVVMSAEHELSEGVYFYVFDCIPSLLDLAPDVGHSKRWDTLRTLLVACDDSRVVRVRTELCISSTVDFWLEDYINSGYEGIVVRNIDAPYKHGRASTKIHEAIKFKKCATSEGVVVAVEQGFTNNNEATVDALGRKTRSSHQANKVPNGMVATLTVSMPDSTLATISAGSMTHEQRKYFWENQHLILGRIATFDHQEEGAKDTIRFGRWKGWRTKEDL